MFLKIECEYCGNEELEETDVQGEYYCRQCDDIINFNELNIEIMEELKW